MGMKRDSAGVPRGLVRQGDLLLVPVAGLPEGADRCRFGPARPRRGGGDRSRARRG